MDDDLRLDISMEEIPGDGSLPDRLDRRLPRQHRESAGHGAKHPGRGGARSAAFRTRYRGELRRSASRSLGSPTGSIQGSLGYFPSNATLASVLGDYVSTGLGVLGISWQSSPALTELEEVVMNWVRQMVGLSSKWRGVIQDTASVSTLVALLCAREKSSSFSLSHEGLQSRMPPLTVYASFQSHSSVEKAGPARRASGAIICGSSRATRTSGCGPAPCSRIWSAA